MVFSLKKKTDAAPEPKPGPEPVPLSEFIPYHSHFDPETLITKNGELLQIIRIAGNIKGLDYESGEDHASVREAIRRAIVETAGNDRLAFWIHTLRKRKTLNYRVKFRETFAAHVDERWRQKHRWKHQYYNEIYITVLHESQPAPFLDQKNMAHVLLPRRNRAWRNAYLEAAREELGLTVEAIIDHIRAHYDARRLSVVERTAEHGRPVAYSEPMEFLHTLLNLRSESVPLPEADLSQALAPAALTFGFSAVEAKSARGKRRFATVLSVKQYREIPPETNDRFLQAPMEFVITQTFNFIPHELALKQYELQKSLFEMSGDFGSLHNSGIVDMLGSRAGRPTDFGNQQITIMVLADDFKQIEGEAKKVQAAFAALGLITIREDLKLEECFWSQLPGNFEFIRRSAPLNTSRIGGFCRLNRFPAGVATESHWGNAVVQLPTMVGAPYLFNFHHRDNGHTLLFDFNPFHDPAGHILLHFLLAETRQYGGRLYLFDRKTSAQLLWGKLGGSYHLFPCLEGSRDEGLALNPFMLEDSPRNRAFLVAWCGSLVSPDAPLSDSRKQSLAAAIEQLYATEPGERHLGGLVERLAAMYPELAKAFSPWHGNGTFAGLFDARKETLDLARPMHAFDMTRAVRGKTAAIPLFSYLLHRIVTGLDGSPTIIVLHEAVDLIENTFFAPRLESLLEMLRQNNAMIVFTSENPASLAGTHCLPTLMRHCATHLYVPADIMPDYAGTDLDLNDADVRMLARMDRLKGDFLLKQGGESIALNADLHGGLEDLRAIFAGDIRNLIAAGNKLEE